MTTLFQNARQVAHYASFRPTYPAALLERILAHAPDSTAAADIGCGSGQATASLARYFHKVTGVDPSESQINAAKQEHPNIDFVVGRESHLPFADQSLDCVTVAQAAHWFDLPIFYKEVDRVLKTKGLLAIWCYGLPEFPRHSELQHMINHDFYEVTLGPYTDERRRFVEHMYKDLATIDSYHPNYTTQSMDDKALHIQREVSHSEIIGYLRSWSGYSKYCERHNIAEGSKDDPIGPIEALLSKSPEHESILLEHPIRVLLSVKEN